MGEHASSLAPSAPWITSVEEIVDEQSLVTRTWINENIKQDSNNT